MTHTALVLGSGPCAGKVAEDLLETGLDVILTSTDHPHPPAPRLPEGLASGGSLQVMKTTELTACRGSAGDFTVTFAAEIGCVDHRVGAIVIAEEDVRRSTRDLYGLTFSDRVVPLSALNADTRDALEGVKNAVLISGACGESCATVAAEVMQTAIRLQAQHIQTYVLTGNLKVAGEGLEAAYRQAKTAGAVFFKFDGQAPEFTQKADGGVEVAFEDPVLGQPCRLTPDLCVLDEKIEPSPALARLAGILNLRTGPDGFIQTDNVHRHTVFTLRKGILAVGPSRRAQPREAQLRDSANAALTVFGLLAAGAADPVATAEIDPNHCIRCLTCLRLCPYGAVAVDIRPVISPEACAGCGICAAECPRVAISIEGLGRDEMGARIAAPLTAADSGTPRIVAFCCSRSAAQAARLAVGLSGALPVGLTTVEVPCAGGVSLEHLLTAFRQKADGVLVLSCHTDNCHSESGNRHARMRVAHLLERLSAVGIDSRRLVAASLAANMGREFHDIVANFEAELTRLGTAENA